MFSEFYEILAQMYKKFPANKKIIPLFCLFCMKNSVTQRPVFSRTLIIC